MNSLHRLLSIPLDLKPEPESAQIRLFPIKSAQGAIQKLLFVHGYYRTDTAKESRKQYCECRDYDPCRHAHHPVRVFEQKMSHEGIVENNPKAISQLIKEIEQLIDSL
jgi:hypothetical protein